VYAAPAVAAPQSDSPGNAGWLAETFLEHWLPVRLTWGINGRPSMLTLRRVLGSGPGKAMRDRADESLLAGGVRVRLVEVQDAGLAGIALREWFRGYVGRSLLLVDAGDDGESCELVAYGPEALLRGKVVSGQWHAAQSVADAIVAGSFDPAELRRAGTFRSHIPAVFNAGGLPNSVPAASGAAWRLDTRALGAAAASRVFDAPGRCVSAAGRTYRAECWDPASAVRSMVEMVDDYAVLSPASLGMMPSELAGCVMGEVDVEGLSLLEAIAAVLDPIGYGYCIEPWADSRGRHALRVFELRGRVSGSRVRRPFMAPIDGPAVRAADSDAQRAEVQRIEFARDNHDVFNDVTVLGSPVRRQVSLVFSGAEGDLYPAWDADEHDLSDWATDGVVDPLQWTASGSFAVAAFDERYTYGAASAVHSRHAFRSFAWNEDGSLLGVTGRMGDLSGFALTPDGRYVRRPRPVGPTLLRDDPAAKVRNFPPQVLLGVAGDDDSWIQVPAVIWTDRAGFTLPVNPLWRWYPYACEQARNVTSGDQTLFDKYGGQGYLTLLNNALTGESPALAMKLVGSIECDHAVLGRAARRADSSWPIVAQKVIRAGQRFRRLDVPVGADPYGMDDDRHDTRDDVADAAAYAREIRAAMQDETGQGSILLRQVTMSYAPGDVIPGTRGRRIDLTVSGSSGARAPVVVGVNWDFRPEICKTELLLDTPGRGGRR
jgi:hypothetical protein